MPKIPKLRLTATPGKSFSVCLVFWDDVDETTPRSFTGYGFYLGFSASVDDQVISVPAYVWSPASAGGLLMISIPYVYFEEFKGCLLSGQLVAFNESGISDQDILADIELMIGEAEA